MQFLAELFSAAEGDAPVAQEFYLFFFFVLGFLIFRTETASKFISFGPRGGKGKLAEGAFGEPNGSGAWCSLSQLRAHFEQQRFEQVLEAWAELESFTCEALTLVVRALLALRRPDDVGLFVAKAVANLPELRSGLHDLIAAVSASAPQTSRACVAVAIQDLFDQARSALDVRGARALLKALAQINDETRVAKLLVELSEKGSAPGAEMFADLASTFAQCRNLKTALTYLKQLLTKGEAASNVTRDVTLAVVRTAITSGAEDVQDSPASLWSDEADSPAQEQRPSYLGLLEVFEAVADQGQLVPVEAASLVLEWVAKGSEPDVGTVQRAESVLRRTAVQAGIDALPVGALDALVRVHASSDGDQARAVACFEELMAGGRSPTEGSFVGMLSACVASKNAPLAQHILNKARESSLCTLPIFSAALKVFILAKKPDLVCEAYEATVQEGNLELDGAVYGAVIKCAVAAGRTELARSLYKKAQNPDVQNSVSLIRACGQEGDVPQAVKLLFDLHARGAADTPAFNACLDVAVSAGDSEAVKRILAEMKSCRKMDVVSFNILLKLPSQNGSCSVLEEMASYGLRPNISTYNSLLGKSLAVGEFDQGWKIIDKMERGPGVDAYTLSILFKGYKGRRCVMSASAFNRALGLIAEYGVKVDEVLVNVTLESCFALKDSTHVATALAALRKAGWTMPKQCAMHTYATLVKAYGMSRQLNVCWKLWSEATGHGAVASEQLYGQMIDVLVSSGRLDDALSLFEDMKAKHGAQSMGSQGFAVAYAMVIRGHAQRRECWKALQCYEEIKEHKIKIGLVVFNTLVDACSRVGDMEAAAGIFRDMVEAEHVPDLITYSTLIKGYCVSGDLEKALELFGAMKQKGIQPDAIVFNSLLDGCAKKQLPKLCDQVVEEMEQAGVPPSNHSASILIKLHGRCRDVAAAFRVFEELPKKFGFRPNAAVYTCLMSTCISNGRLDLALDLRKRMTAVGETPDEKTYSTLLRGCLRSSSAEDCAMLLRAAIDQPGGCKNVLDEELAQSSLTLLQRSRGFEDEGKQLYERLQRAGLALRAPGDRRGNYGGHYGGGESRRRRS